MAFIVDTPGARRLDYDEVKTIPPPQGTALGNRLPTLGPSTMLPKPSKTRAFKSPKWTWRLLAVTTGFSGLLMSRPMRPMKRL